MLERVTDAGIGKEVILMTLAEVKRTGGSWYHTNVPHLIERLRKLGDLGLVTVESYGEIKGDEELADGELIKATVTPEGEKFYSSFEVTL